MTANHARNTLDLIEKLDRRVKDLEAARAAGAQFALCTSTTHPANPPVGRQILETDTGLTAMWTGTAWLYPPQLLAQQTLGAAGAISLPVPAGGHFNTLHVVWTGASTTGGTATYMCCRLNSDGSTSYAWDFNQASNSSASSAGSGGTAAQIQIGTLSAAGGTPGYLGSGSFLIPNANGSTYKEPTGFSNSQNAANNGFSGTYGGIWLSTAAIASIQLFALAGSLTAGSSAWLYGMP